MTDRNSLEFLAWNPGLEADLPRRYMALETIHRTANVHTRLADIPELSALTRLPKEELVAFRAERLVLHELIVQVTADVVVLEGEEEELLGQHFRGIASKILSDYLAHRMPTFQQEYYRLHDEIHGRVGGLLAAAFAPEPTVLELESGSWLSRWLGRR